MTEANHERRPNEIPALSPKSPVSKSNRPPSPWDSNITLDGGYSARRPEKFPVRSKTNYARRSNRRAHHRAQRLSTIQDVRRRGWKRAGEQSCGVSEYTDDGDSLEPSSMSSGNADSMPRTFSSFTPEASLGARATSDFQRSELMLRSASIAEQDEALLRRRALHKLEEQEKKRASEKYQETGDISVFAPFMAPFIGGPDRPKLGSWVWDKSVERWRREHELEGRIVWAPTEDSFI